MPGYREKIKQLEQKLADMEGRFSDLIYNTQGIVQEANTERKKVAEQPQPVFGMYTALCVDTMDVWKQNRVRFFCPILHDPKTPLKSLPWAYPISAMGGFDASGLSWPPPAGSTICIIFEGGNREAPYYMGTTWHRNRGPTGQNKWTINIDEYQKVYEGHRKSYLVGPNDESQVLPPWNTESAKAYDINSATDIDQNPEAQKDMTYPHIYGFATNEKHTVKLHDGDPKNNRKGKRLEIFSSRSGGILIKDDPYTSDIADNKFFKHKNEQRIAKKYELKQVGVQIVSHSSATLIFDDSVKAPSGVPKWEEDFKMSDTFTGKTLWRSATKHSIEMNDKEESEGVRGEDNYIRILSASGNRVELNDHTAEEIAGAKRGITIQSTSKHIIELHDEGNEQKAGRKGGGKPTNKAKKAYVRIRTGYGIEIMMKDDDNQKNTKRQSFQIRSPHKDNKKRGPHVFRMQEAKSGPGLVFLRSGGNYVLSVYDNKVEMVGDEQLNPADNIELISRKNVVFTKDDYINISDKQHVFIAKDRILLLAGKDCDGQSGAGPCIGPVLVYVNGCVRLSDRLYATASKGSTACSIFMLEPLAACKAT